MSEAAVGDRERVRGAGAVAREPGTLGDRRLPMVGAAGVSAVGIYAFAVVLGGVLDPSYSHLRDTVSELTSSHAPDRVALGALFLAYNAALVPFAAGLYRTGPRTRGARAALVCMIAIAVGGVLLVVPFPQDSLGRPGTAAGAMHIALAAVVAPLTVATTFLLGFAFRSDARWRGLSGFSMAMGFAILATGAAAGIGAAGGVAFSGLLERLTIGAFLLWVLVLGLHALRNLRPEGRRNG